MYIKQEQERQEENLTTWRTFIVEIRTHINDSVLAIL